MEMKGKAALVTGGTRGIGAATALLLAGEGADVAIAARHDDDAARQVRRQIESQGRRCVMITADLAKPTEATRCVQEAVSSLGSVEIVVHSAGGLVAGRLLELSPETWYEGFEVHVHAIFHLCRAAVPLMRAKKEGAVVLISSAAGVRSFPNNIGYQVMKGALPHFARALARELSDDNIRVNCVAPGVIRTRFHERMTPEQRKLNLDHRIPLHREGTPEQVAHLIAQLIENDYVTGETVVIDGGLCMRLP